MSLEIKAGYVPVKVYVLEWRREYDSGDIWGVYQTLEGAKADAQKLHDSYVERLTRENLYTANMAKVLDWQNDGDEVTAYSDSGATLVISEWIAT